VFRVIRPLLGSEDGKHFCEILFCPLLLKHDKKGDQAYAQEEN